MNCPTCRVELRMADRQDVEVDYCPRCRGVWLDRGELERIIELSMPAAVSGRVTAKPYRADQYRREEQPHAYYGVK